MPNQEKRLVDIWPTLSRTQQKTLDALFWHAEVGAPVGMLSQVSGLPEAELRPALESLADQGLVSWRDEAHQGCALTAGIHEQLESPEVTSLPFSPEI